MMARKWTSEDVAHVIANPFYAVRIAPWLGTEHPTLISEDEWVQANVQLVEEMGTEEWLRLLLSVLKSEENPYET